ncbi:LOB domain-containing protein 4-like [Rhododendron vialii]|uniref:LOB domain-containing protein 4-like n=1 Tax=Rhododendron vialii TaxID=182163 RepID=UPI00266054A7|nr:LOB domain-containing protein 4-like [Rhododendron vialii]
MSDNEGPMNRVACASCKHQRKRCQESCVMAPHFPQRLTDEFQAVHKIFGIANVTRTIKALDFGGQREAIKSFIWEAMAWDQDPVRGPYREVERLRDRIRSLEEQKQQQEAVIQNMQRQLLSQWDSGVVNFSPDNATLMAESSARNVINYASVIEEKDGSGLMGTGFVQGRGFVPGANPSDFNYHSGSFGQELQERGRGNSSSGGAIYSGGFGQGRGRGFGGAWRSTAAVGQNNSSIASGVLLQ